MLLGRQQDAVLLPANLAVQSADAYLEQEDDMSSLLIPPWQAG
jgi:hypothetical protein